MPTTYYPLTPAALERVAQGFKIPTKQVPTLPLLPISAENLRLVQQPTGYTASAAATSEEKTDWTPYLIAAGLVVVGVGAAVYIKSRKKSRRRR